MTCVEKKAIATAAISITTKNSTCQAPPIASGIGETGCTGGMNIGQDIAHYLTELDTADRQEPEVAQVRTRRLQEKIAVLQEQMQAMKEVEAVPATALSGTA